jgi:Fe-S oxidoreductase
MEENTHRVHNQRTINKINEFHSNCVQCGECVKNCMMLQEYCKEPKDFFRRVESKKSIEGIIPFSCSLCGKCNLVCPKKLDIEGLFMSLREDIVKDNNGQSPLKGHGAIHMHQKFSFSSLFSGVIKENEKVERVFMPGCTLCSYNYDLVLETYNYLKDKMPDLGLLIGCCGRPTKDLGEIDKFNNNYSKLDTMIKESGAKEVITACQSCLKTIGEQSSEYEVISLWTVLRDIGIPEEAKGIGQNSDIEFSIKDSCASMRNVELQDSIRQIIDDLGYKVKETKDRNTGCCGTGGMIHTVNGELSKKIMKNNAENCDSEYTITYCGGCRNSMIGGGKKSLHILDLVFNDTWTRKSTFPHIVGTLKGWINRYKVKSKAR